MANTAKEATYGQTLKELFPRLNLKASVTRIVIATISVEVVIKDGIGECVEVSLTVPVSGDLIEFEVA